MPDSKDEARALLDAYARATSPSPAEIEHSLTRTLARIESAERSASLPDRRRKFVGVAAAGVATLAIATAALACVRWYRAQARAEPHHHGAAELERAQDNIATRATQATPTATDAEPSSEQPTPGSGSEAEPIPKPEPEPKPANLVPKPSPHHRARAEHPKPQAASSDSSTAIEASTLAEESRLLARVRRALRDKDFDAALDWAEEHARRHPHGSLSEERLILEAVAACRAGQRDRGRAAVRQLREQFPKTAALAKVEQACAGE